MQNFCPYPDKGDDAKVFIHVEILRSHCANFGKCGYVYDRTVSGDIILEKEFTFLYDISHGMSSQDLIMVSNDVMMM